MEYLDLEKRVETSNALKTSKKTNIFVSLEKVVYNVEAKKSVNKFKIR